MGNRIDRCGCTCVGGSNWEGETRENYGEGLLILRALKKSYGNII